MLNYLMNHLGTVVRRVGIVGGSTEIVMDDMMLKIYIQDCIASLKRTHPTFTYSPNLKDITIYNRWVYIRMINDLIKEPELGVDIFWQDIGDVCPLSLFNPDSNKVFPTDLSEDEKFELQKLIIKKIWEEYKK